MLRGPRGEGPGCCSPGGSPTGDRREETATQRLPLGCCGQRLRLHRSLRWGWNGGRPGVQDTDGAWRKLAGGALRPESTDSPACGVDQGTNGRPLCTRANDL